MPPVDLLTPVQSLLRGQGALGDVEKALAEGASPNEWVGPLSPLRCAVQAHHLPLLQLLLSKGADTNAKDHRGVSALHIAVFDGNIECAKSLLDAQADPNVPDRHGQTPLFFAPTRQVCELLITRTADINVRNAKKQSPLHLAAHAGLNDAVAWLAEVNKRILDAPDAKGHTPLNYATHARVASTIGVLKQKAEAAAAAAAVAEGAMAEDEPEASECHSPIARDVRASFAGADDSAGPPELPPEVPQRHVHMQAEAPEEKAVWSDAEELPLTPSAGPLGTIDESQSPARAVASESQRIVANRQAAAQRARSLRTAEQQEQPMIDIQSEDSEEARAEQRVPNREVQQEEEDGCLVWEVMLKKESSTDKFGFVQANGKLEFETRLANPSQRLVAGAARQALKKPEASPLPGPPVLTVRRIHEGLLLHRWNQKYPSIAVMPQDRIVSVNGETSLDTMQREIKSSKIVIKFMRYPQTFSLTLRKGDRRLGFRFERPTDGSKTEEVRFTEVLADGALPDYNREMVEAGRYQYVVLPDMRITAANDISGDGAAIAEELKRCEAVTLVVRRADQGRSSAARNKLRMMAAMMGGGAASAISDADGCSTAFSWVPGASTCDGAHTPQAESPQGTSVAAGLPKD